MTGDEMIAVGCVRHMDRSDLMVQKSGHHAKDGRNHQNWHQNVGEEEFRKSK